MRAAILSGGDSVEWFTELGDLWKALPGVLEGHDWFVSDLECHGLNLVTPLDQRFQASNHKTNGFWITGPDLVIAINRTRMQISWAVLSGTEAGHGFFEVASEPYADGNASVWDPSASLQLPQAEIEIVCWDSSATIVKSTDPEIINTYRQAFEAVDLAFYNEQIRRTGSLGSNSW